MARACYDELLEARLILLGAVHIIETEVQEITEILQEHRRAAIIYDTICIAALHALSCIEDALHHERKERSDGHL